MSGSSGVGQLFKGIVIGVVLLLAIVGTMSILDKGKQIAEGDSSTETKTKDIPAPSINIATSKQTQANVESAKLPESQTKTDEKPSTDSFTPKLEGEKIAELEPKEESEQPKVIEYGMLELGVINPSTGGKLKADYTIYDDKNNLVAESKSTEGTTVRLPIGKYKVVTTLNKAKDAVRKTEDVQTTQFVTVIADKTSSNTFELEPPPTTGVLQVTAVNSKDGNAVKANFIVQKENGETVASRQNVTASLFKLKAGSYKVTVRSGNNSDFRTIVVEPGQSTQETFKLTEAYKLGRVLVRIFDTKTNKPITANIVISTSNGTAVQELKAVSQTEISLPAANYKIRVTGPNGQSSKNIQVIAGQVISEIFRFDAPIEDIVESDNNSSGTQINDNVKISGVDDNTAENEASNDPTKATIILFSKNDRDQKSLKSNFYIQTRRGKHIAKKIYADSAEFDLNPGIYKITIRSKNRSNIVRNIEVFAGQKISQTFSLKKPNGAAQTKTPTLAPPKPAPSAVRVPTPKSTIANGFLYVAMNPAQKTHFIVATRAGKKIVELTSVPNGSFKLDVGQYVVTAIHNNIRRRQNIRVSKGKTTRLVFNARHFQRPPPKNSTNSSITKGVLRSRILDRSGQALRGDLTVTNNRGQVVARANAVTVGIFDLAPGTYTIILNYRGLRGNERINVVSRETTVQTFTISPNNAPAPQEQTRKKSLKEMLKEKLEEEIRKQF